MKISVLLKLKKDEKVLELTLKRIANVAKQVSKIKFK